ncbi:MAG: DNA-3-methyladenine glycosylase [Oscillospiraceae bacterium]
MTETLTNQRFTFCSAEELDPVKTFDCGQCFRWNADARGAYIGVASGRAARVSEENGIVSLETCERDLPFWRVYFDMDTDYKAARASVESCDYMRECAEYGAGIRILRQDGWEALCSFIISQCNNIPRIKGIVEKLCALYGEPLSFCGETLYTFPSAERIALLDESDLAPLRSGYRAEYIIAAARAVADGSFDLNAAAAMPCDEARAALKSLRGVGDKVANCAVLFGLHRMDAFPVDTWMKKALKAHFPPDFNPESLGEYAGLAQQYIFYHARSGADSNNC